MRETKPKLRYLKWRRTLSDLSGRVAVVTGANGGLGFETARGLLSLHARVILACRDENKGREALARLLKEFPEGSLDLLPLDLSRRDSITEFSARLAGIAPKIDVFVHCAGVYYPKETKTPDGLPATVGINFVGTVSLAEATERLLSPDGRAVFVTSLVDRKGSVKTDPRSDDQPSGYLAYARSKFLLSGYVLKKSAAPTVSAPIFVAAHPGITKTPLLAKEKTGPRPRWSRWGHALLYPFTHSPEKASLPILYAAAGKVENGDLIAPRGLFHVWGYPKKLPFCVSVRNAVKKHPEWFE
ncbi:MAG: SDR family NAD(P)-dependent oxidoreductase [Clostridia bacterium]|nr:SDR family NAD(P)-dependent oxidoreductase [Clostridia bacterium]